MSEQGIGNEAQQLIDKIKRYKFHIKYLMDMQQQL
jgi:hypothetical protein